LNPTQEIPSEEPLLQVIDTINEDVALIELWACALSSFAQPAPDYDFGDTFHRSAKQG
jgi:hypothetical protein